MWNGGRLAFAPVAEYMLLGALAVFSIGLAVSELQLSARFADLSLLGERIELGQEVSRAAVSIIAADADEVRDLGICRSDIVLAGAKAVLQRVDNSDEATNYEEWWTSIVAAEKYLQQALSCLPGDGNLWLRYAAIDATIAEGPAKAAQLMAISALRSPADESDLLARVYFWNRLSPETVSAGADTVRHDIKATLEKATPASIHEILPEFSDALKPYIAEVAKGLSEQRRRDLARRGVDLGTL